MRIPRCLRIDPLFLVHSYLVLLSVISIHAQARTLPRLASNDIELALLYYKHYISLLVTMFSLYVVPLAWIAVIRTEYLHKIHVLVDHLIPFVLTPSRPTSQSNPQPSSPESHP